MSDDAILTAERISHAYAVDGGMLPAVEDVSLELTRESFVCLIGPSGCGKSTFLRILSGLLRPRFGWARLEGQPITRPQRRIGLVFQQANLMPWRTVRGNLALPLQLAGLPAHRVHERTDAMLEMLGLQDFGGTYPAALSGGMAQRVAIGRALIHEPEVLLLDEPFGSLDALTREHMSEELLRLWAKQRKTVLMVTHSIPEAVLLADRVVVFSPRPGRIVCDMPIPLPRPRSLHLLRHPDFIALSEELRAAIRVG